MNNGFNRDEKQKSWPIAGANEKNNNTDSIAVSYYHLLKLFTQHCIERLMVFERTVEGGIIKS